MKQRIELFKDVSSDYPSPEDLVPVCIAWISGNYIYKADYADINYWLEYYSEKHELPTMTSRQWVDKFIKQLNTHGFDIEAKWVGFI